MGQEENRGGTPGAESDADRARREQDLRGRAEPETNESRQMRAEEENRRRGEEEKKKLTGDAGTRELVRILQQSAVFHHASSETAQRDLDRLRVALGDEEHGAHVVLRDYHRALANHSGYPSTPAGNLALAREIDEAKKAVEANPIAKQRFDAIERARRRGEPVDFTPEGEGAAR